MSPMTKARFGAARSRRPFAAVLLSAAFLVGPRAAAETRTDDTRRELLQRVREAPEDPLPALLLAELAARAGERVAERDWLATARRRCAPGALADWIDARRETLRLAPPLVASSVPPARRRAQAAHVEALDLLRRGELARGASILQEALALDPGFCRPRFDLALIAEGAGDFAAAVRWLEQLLACGPEDALGLEAELRLRRLRPLARLASDEEGARTLRYLLEIERASALSEAGRFDAALAELAQAEAREPRRHEAPFAAAAVLHAAGRVREAEQAAGRAVELAPAGARAELEQVLRQVAVAPASAVAPTWADERGWHGEPLPEGLRRAETRGEYRWRDGSLLVYVPESTEQDGGSPEERAPFYVDKHEVSWERFEAACAAAGRPAPERPSWAGPEHPVVGVTWEEARQHALRIGKLLPSEAQWQRAARGPRGAGFPWGAELAVDCLNLCDRRCPLELRWRLEDHDDGHPRSAPVGSYPRGASMCGALDMAGNVREWCADALGAESELRSVRGGGWQSGLSACRTDYRSSLPAQARREDVGFRCVVPAVPDRSGAGGR